MRVMLFVFVNRKQIIQYNVNTLISELITYVTHITCLIFFSIMITPAIPLQPSLKLTLT